MSDDGQLDAQIDKAKQGLVHAESVAAEARATFIREVIRTAAERIDNVVSRHVAVQSARTNQLDDATLRALKEDLTATKGGLGEVAAQAFAETTTKEEAKDAVGSVLGEAIRLLRRYGYSDPFAANEAGDVSLQGKMWSEMEGPWARWEEAMLAVSGADHSVERAEQAKDAAIARRRWEQA